MKQLAILSTVAALITLVAPLCMATMKTFASDEDAIRKWMGEYTSAWNKHDAKKLALLYREDADFIGGSGGVFRGRPQIERLMTEEFSGVLKEWEMRSVIEDIRFIKPDVAIVNGT
ncbi:MAG: SgcJ/EcaC family oxidoreductase, partial [Acidobacteria bacterium]|nr:SgcJ/EcaC family oxidoreductase [Acidobacteriota bacterium]